MRIHAIEDPADVADPEYAAGLRQAIAVAFDFGLRGIESVEDRESPVPLPLLAQARLAARSRVGLDTVLRRYLAGYTLLGNALAEWAAIQEVGDVQLQQVARRLAMLMDRLLAAVAEEYRSEEQRLANPSQRYRVEIVRRLLDGDLIDTATLGYDLQGVHLGLIATGEKAAEAIRSLASALDRRLLLVFSDESVWAWIGGRRAPDEADLARVVPQVFAGMSLALGEPGEGLTGWRLTHRQAKAALPVAVRTCKTFVRYGEVALLAAALRDDLLATSLRQLYLDPIEGEGDGGQRLRETLGAYFAADRNVSSAAAALRASRNTIAGRLAGVEQRLGRSLPSCAADLELALGLEELERHVPFAAT